MRKAVFGLFLVFVVASLTACATTSFTSSWKSPDAQPMGSLAGQKVVAVAVTKNQAMRRSSPVHTPMLCLVTIRSHLP